VTCPGSRCELADLLGQHLSAGLIVERHSHPTRVHCPLLYPALRQARSESSDVDHWVPRLDSCAMHIGQSLLQDCFRKKPRSLTEAVNNPCFVEIVRRHLQLNAVARGKPDKAFSHFPRDVSEDMMLIRQLHPEHSSR